MTPAKSNLPASCQPKFQKSRQEEQVSSLVWFLLYVFPLVFPIQTSYPNQYGFSWIKNKKISKIRIFQGLRNLLIVILGLPASARIYPKDLSGGPQEYEALLDVKPWPKNMLCFG